MKLEIIVKDTSKVEVTNISTHGIWLLSNNKEMFLAYNDFPWFKDVPLKHILNVEELTPDHFYWPDLDIDLSTAIIKNPQRFPYIAKPK